MKLEGSESGVVWGRGGRGIASQDVFLNRKVSKKLLHQIAADLFLFIKHHHFRKVLEPIVAFGHVK